MENNGWELVGRGMTAEVYKIAKDEVLKLFHGDFDPQAVLYEARLLQAVSATAAPAPRFLRTETHQGRLGIVSEFVPGPSLMDVLVRRPLGSGSTMKALARSHFDLHRQSGVGLPGQHERFTAQLERAPGLEVFKPQLLQTLKRITKQDRLCHGDYHCGNIIVNGAKHVALDWMNGYAGDPESDVVRSYLMLASPFDPFRLPGILRLPFLALKRRLARVYLGEYLRLAGWSRRRLRPWWALVAAVRLGDRIASEERWLKRLISRWVKQGSGD